MKWIEISYIKWFCIIYFFIVGIVFLLIIPPTHSPDEIGHVSYINFLVNEKTLPNQTIPELKERWQGHQPPLYYICGYAINSLFNDGEPITIHLTGVEGGAFDLSPNSTFSNPLNYWHINFSFYLLRLFSLILGAITIFYVGKIAEHIFEKKLQIFFSIFFVASLPQFIFISSSINNDNMVNAFATISILYMYRIISDKNTLKDVILCSVFLALGFLTKKSIAYFALPIFLIFFLWLKQNNRFLVRNLIWFALTFFVLTAFYLYRNIIIYSEPWGFEAERLTFSHFNDKSIFSVYFISPFLPGLFVSFIAFYGYMNIRLPIYLYSVYIILFMLVPLAILSTQLLKRNKQYILALIIVFSAFAGVIYYNLMISQYQGRFMFPAIGAFSITIAISIEGLIRRYNISNFLYYIFIVYFVFMDIYSIAFLYSYYYT